MEVAFIADIHANLTALEAVLGETDGLEVFNCGDIVGYGPHPNECVELIQSEGVRGIMGNHDYAAVTGELGWFNSDARRAIQWTIDELDKSNVDYLAALPRSLEEDRFTAFHGSPNDPLFEYVFPMHTDEKLSSLLGDSKVLVLAHTHIPFVKSLEKGLVFNPGSVGQPRDGDPRASYAILNFDSGGVEIRRVSYDIKAEAAEIIRAGLPRSFADRLSRGG